MKTVYAFSRYDKIGPNEILDIQFFIQQIQTNNGTSYLKKLSMMTRIQLFSFLWIFDNIADDTFR